MADEQARPGARAAPTPLLLRRRVDLSTRAPYPIPIVNTPLLRLLACGALLAPGTTRAGPSEALYVALGGSSDAAGVARAGDPARIAAALEPGRRVRVVDLTAAGATVRAVRDRQLSTAISLRPALVSISVGPLDVLAGTSLAEFSRDLHVITDLLRHTRAIVVISTVPPGDALRPGASARLRHRADAFDSAIRLAARRNGLLLADVRAPGEESWQAAVVGQLRPRADPPVPPGTASPMPPVTAREPPRRPEPVPATPRSEREVG